MELRNCSRCGKVYTYVNRSICPACAELEEKDFEKVREYLQEHKGSGVEDIHRETGVSRETILEFIRLGRIAVSGHAEVHCRVCQSPIERGMLCGSCSAGLRRETGALKAGLKGEGSGSRMYIQDWIMGKKR